MKKSRMIQARNNAVAGFMYKFVILFLTFINRKLFLKYIGVEYLGINSLFSNVLSILCLADLGVGIAMNYVLYEPLNNNDKNRIAALIHYFRKIYLRIAATVFVIGLGLIPFLKYIINIDREISGLYIYYLLFLIQTCSSYLFVYKTTLLTADQRSYINNMVMMLVSVVKVLVQIICIVFIGSYYVYIVVDIIATLASNIILSIITDKYYPYLKTDAELDENNKDAIRQNISSVFLYKLSGVLINSTDNIIISSIVGTLMLGYYANYNTIINQLVPFITILFTSITASVGNLLVSDDNSRKYRVFKVSTFVSNYLGLVISVCFLLLIQDFIVLWIGKDYVLNYAIVISVVANFYYSCINQPVWTYREASGLYTKIKYVMLFTAIMNIVLSIAGGMMFGIAGIVAATFVSKLIFCFWYEPKLLFEEHFKESPKTFYLMCLKQLIILGVSVSISWFAVSGMICTNWYMWLFKAMCTGVIASLVYMVGNKKEESFKLTLEYAKTILNRRRTNI